MIFFYFFYDFLCDFAIFDLFSRSITQIKLKLNGYVPDGRAKQSCSLGGSAVVS